MRGKIKIIKRRDRDDRDRETASESSVGAGRAAEQIAEREAISTAAGWIEEFGQRREAEIKDAVKHVTRKVARPPDSKAA